MDSLLLTSSSSPSIAKLSTSPFSSSFSPKGHSSFFLYFPKNINPSFKLNKTSVIASAAFFSNSNYNDKKADSCRIFAKKREEDFGYEDGFIRKKKALQENGGVLPEYAENEEVGLLEALDLQLESDQKVDQMRHYEVVYLIHENRVDEVESVNTKIQEFLKEKKGKIWRFSDWGMRRLAYPIQKTSRAHYILMNFEIEAKWINDFKSMLDKDERVIRHLVMKQDKAETEDCPPPPEFGSLGGDDEDDFFDDDEDEDEEEYDDEEEDEEEYDDEEEDEEEYDDDDENDEDDGEGEDEDDVNDDEDSKVVETVGKVIETRQEKGN